MISQNIHEAFRRSFGYWQMGKTQPAGPVAADIDLHPERRDKLVGKLLAALQGWFPARAPSSAGRRVLEVPVAVDATGWGAARVKGACGT